LCRRILRRKSEQKGKKRRGERKLAHPLDRNGNAGMIRGGYWPWQGWYQYVFQTFWQQSTQRRMVEWMLKLSRGITWEHHSWGGVVSTKVEIHSSSISSTSYKQEKEDERKGGKEKIDKVDRGERKEEGRERESRGRAIREKRREREWGERWMEERWGESRQGIPR
jgi:hypothetical protein